MFSPIKQIYFDCVSEAYNCNCCSLSRPMRPLQWEGNNGGSSGVKGLTGRSRMASKTAGTVLGSKLPNLINPVWVLQRKWGTVAITYHSPWGYTRRLAAYLSLSQKSLITHAKKLTCVPRHDRLPRPWPSAAGFVWLFPLVERAPPALPRSHIDSPWLRVCTRIDAHRSHRSCVLAGRRDFSAWPPRHRH